MASLVLYICLAFGGVCLLMLLPVCLVDEHTGIFTDVLIAFTFMLIPVISWSMFFTWLFWENKSAIYRFGPGFVYDMHPVLVFFSIIHCNH